MKTMQTELQVAKEAAEAGGAVIVRAFPEGIAVRSKAVSDLVTDADLESEVTIARVIREAFPDHAVLGEEALKDDVSAEHLWIVDPLDGTTNFAHGIPHFAVSIAYYHFGRAMCGVIYNPITNDWYTAAKGEGAFANGKRVAVTPADALDQVLIGVGFYYDRGQVMEATLMAIRDLFRQQIHGVRRFGTASLDLAAVGTGKYAAFFEYQLSPWDFAAGRLFVEEAGGNVTTCTGSELPLAKSSVLASNGILHEAVLAIVKSHYITQE
jgi:myo-inositol-1(or 4)-monophosphatase